MKVLNDGNDVLAGLQVVELAGIDTGLTADTLAVVDFNTFRAAFDSPPIAGFFTAVRFIRRAEAGFYSPNQRMVIGMS